MQLRAFKISTENLTSKNDLLLRILEHSQQTIEQHQQTVPPGIYMLFPRSIEIIDVTPLMESDAAKDVMVKVIRKLVNEKKPAAVAMVSEAWFTKKE